MLPTISKAVKKSSFPCACQSAGAVRKSRWTSWAPVPNKPTVSVDIKQHFNQHVHVHGLHMSMESYERLVRSLTCGVPSPAATAAPLTAMIQTKPTSMIHTYKWSTQIKQQRSRQTSLSHTYQTLKAQITKQQSSGSLSNNHPEKSNIHNPNNNDPDKSNIHHQGKWTINHQDELTINHPSKSNINHQTIHTGTQFHQPISHKKQTPIAFSNTTWIYNLPCRGWQLTSSHPNCSKLQWSC